MKFVTHILILCLALVSFAPISQSYAMTCEQTSFNSSVSSNVSDICEVVVQSEVCSNVPQENRLNCENPEQSIASNVWDYIAGCAGGVLDSVSEMVSFLWEIMKWAWNNVTSSETRGRSLDQANEHMNSALLYLNTEYERAYDRARPPLRTLKAVQSMGGAIGRLIFNSIEQLVIQQYAEFQCLNSRAKSGAVCSLVASFFIPPAAMIGLIKYGPRALRMFPSLRQGLDRARTSVRAVTGRPARIAPRPRPRGPFGSTMSGLAPNMDEIARLGRYERIVAETVDDQVAYLMREVPGMNAEQARIVITGARSRNSSVVFGGSRIRGNYQPGSDLDIGFGNLSTSQAGKVLDKASRVERGLPIEQTRIVPGNQTPSIERIASPEEFFQRQGIRGANDLRAGEEYLPSGSISIFPDGTIIRLYPD